MVTGRPLFCGSSDQDQLLKIFKIMGTPYRAEWSSMTDLPGYKDFDNYPRFEKRPLKLLLPKMSQQGLDLLQVSYIYIHIFIFIYFYLDNLCNFSSILHIYLFYYFLSVCYNLIH